MKKNSTTTGENLRDTFKLTNAVPGMDAADNNITPLEEQLLDAAGRNDDEQQLEKSVIDNSDNEGDLLNENASGDTLTGTELDVPGSENDDDQEELGSEDEENNAYSLGADKKD